MEYRVFGRLGWQVSAIGLGTYAMGGRWGRADDKDSLKVLELAYRSGINLIDTADVYGYGRSERLISRMFSGKLRSDIYIATKGGYDFVSIPQKVYKNFASAYLENALNSSLKRLGTDYVDIYQLHGPDIDTIRIGDAISFLDKMKKAGKIRACGVSVYNRSDAMAALEFGSLDVLQYPYNLLEQSGAKDIFRLCELKGIALIVREPLAQGLLTGKYSVDSGFPPDDFRSKEWTKEFLRDRIEKLSNMSHIMIKHNRTIVQTAIKFILSCKEVSTTIPGARNPKQLQEIVNTLVSDPLSTIEIEELANIDYNEYCAG